MTAFGFLWTVLRIKYRRLVGMLGCMQNAQKTPRSSATWCCQPVLIRGLQTSSVSSVGFDEQEKNSDRFQRRTTCLQGKYLRLRTGINQGHNCNSSHICQSVIGHQLCQPVRFIRPFLPPFLFQCDVWLRNTVSTLIKVTNRAPLRSFEMFHLLVLIGLGTTWWSAGISDMLGWFSSHQKVKVKSWWCDLSLLRLPWDPFWVPSYLPLKSIVKRHFWLMCQIQSSECGGFYWAAFSSSVFSFSSWACEDRGCDGCCRCVSTHQWTL